MANLVIVALPEEDDYVNKLSSEKVAHMTLLFLGDAMQPNVVKMAEFVEHAVSVWQRGPFMLEVDKRGTLGEDNADVLFFEKQGYSFREIEQFRGWLLKDESIRKAYDSVEQIEPWIPHLTMGYPETPAKKDDREYPGMRWVRFDRIALWFGDYEGPEWELEENWDYDLAEVAMSTTADAGRNFLEHYGVLGMRWGVRKAPGVSTQVRTDQGLVKRQTKVVTKGGFGETATQDAVKAAVSKQKLKKSGAAALTNQELRDLAQRLQLEQQVTMLTTSKGKKFVQTEFEEEAKRKARGGARKTAPKVAKAGKLAVATLL